jgi:Tfp pilus assembly protein PilV
LRGSAGFSLIEAIAAAGLLSVVMLGFAMGAGRALRYNQYSRSVAVATTLAHDKIEELESLMATELPLAAGSHSDANSPLTPTGAAGGIYTRTWQVTDNTPAAGIKTIEVTVQWSNYEESHTIRVVAVKS